MNLLTRDDLDKLIEIGDEKCISIYMPMEKISIDAEKSKIEFKNLLKTVEKNLAETGTSSVEIENLMAPAFDLLKDKDFWLKPSESLALFLSGSGMKIFNLTVQVDESFTIGLRYYILPLLKLFSTDNIYYVLAISQEKLRLLVCNMSKCTEIQLSGFPLSIEEALQYDDLEKGHQYNIRSTKSAGDGTPGVFRGHGDGKEEHKINLGKFMEAAEKGLESFIKSKEIPVVLSGVEYVTAIFRKTNSRYYLLEDEISGNPDLFSSKELYEKASPIAQRYFENQLKVELNNYTELISTDKASDDLEEIASAAYKGKVRILFVPTGIYRPGIYNLELDSAILKKEDNETEDLINFAVSHTLRTGGKVHITPQEDIPNGKDCAAIFRY
ncbi:MAG: hypothetical protein HGA49_06650 [Eubacteriaceae bacterium]|nr:hypothetical protein [Eubacteriaceae bacterium]